MSLCVCTSIYNEQNLLGESNSTTPIPCTETSSDFNDMCKSINMHSE